MKLLSMEILSVWRRLVMVSVFMAAVLPGCGKGPEDPTQKGEARTLLLFCGAGIQPPVAELAEAFGRQNSCRVEADYAGSELLLSRITLKRKGDLYMPGDQSYIDMAAARGLVASTVNACYFVPSILVEKGNPLNIRSLEDLVHKEVRLGLGDPSACAIGRQSRKIFEKNNIPWTDVEKNLVFQSMTVNELGLQVQAGSLDAVIVWDAVAGQYLDHGEIVEIPAGNNIISAVPLGILAFSERKTLAQEFADFAVSDEGKAIFRKHHYRVDPPRGFEF
jgi:molybdate transport system substrate-binding protein